MSYINAPGSGGGGGGVTSVNALTGDVVLTEGANITITVIGQDIEIASSGGGSSTITEGVTPTSGFTDGFALTSTGNVVTEAPIPAAANPSATAGPVAINGSATSFMRSDGAPAVQKASNTQFGLVEVDNTTITASAGVISAVQQTLPTGANPSATAGPTAVNGSATTFMRSDAAPAVQKASASQFGIVEVDNTTITASAGVISATQRTAANPSATAGPSAVNGSATTYMRSDAAPAVQTATTGQLGLVQPDGTSIVISGGIISSTGGGGGGLVIGTTTISGGTAGQILYDSGGALVETTGIFYFGSGIGLDIFSHENTVLYLNSDNAAGVSIDLDASPSGGHNFQFFSTGSNDPGAFGVYDATANATWLAIDGTTNGNFVVAANAVFSWSSSAQGFAGPDTGISRTTAAWLEANDGVSIANGGSYANLQGKLTTDTNFTATPVVATGYIVLYDAAGTAYKIPAVPA